jgi:inorganic triphosphatase YgiF
VVAAARRVGAAGQPALLLRPTPVREGDSALVRVLEASIETLKAENEILRRRLAAAEARAVRDTAKAEGAIAEFSAITKRLRARAAALGDGGSRQSRPRLA